MILSQSKHAVLLAVFYAATWGVSSVHAPPDRLVLAAVVAVPLVWLSVVDLRRHEIPDLATLSIALCGAAYQWRSDTESFLATLGVAAAVTLACILLGQRYYQRRGIEALGIGDAKLIGAGTLAVGAASLWAMILLAASGGIVAALLARRRDPSTTGLAFGPFLAYAIFVLVLFPASGPFAP
jgi:leader peptidase (prepilin peptidase) / N-methyltransferase